MDFGTISQKVAKGRYRSLEEFGVSRSRSFPRAQPTNFVHPQNDIRLVTSNAKLFNPPGTIYHSEAERIEQYAVDHINKAAATVIEYEGDWSIDVEQEEEAEARTIADGEDGQGTQMDVDGSIRGRSPSVSSVQTPAARRGAKGKRQPGQVSETLDSDGHLPGYKDGVGVFPAGSEWAELALALKLKGPYGHVRRIARVHSY